MRRRPWEGTYNEFVSSCVAKFSLTCASVWRLDLVACFYGLCLFNFENLEYSGSLNGLSADNLEKIKILIDIVKVVLVCFMVSMIAYASHVF